MLEQRGGAASVTYAGRMSATRLLVLALVRMFPSVHGYDVRRELLSWRAEEWANVAPGSIYHALKALARDGLVEVVGTDRKGARPARTVYRITKEGEKEFATLLREAWWTVQRPVNPLHTAVALMPFMDRDEVKAALESRVKRLEADIAQCQAELQVEFGDPSQGYMPEHVAEMTRLTLRQLQAERDWALDLLERLEQGAYEFATEAMTRRQPAEAEHVEADR